MITRIFKLCLNAGTGSAPYINVSQYDEGETWLFELYSETGERYIPSTGAIVGVKSDGHGIVNTGTVDSEGRVVITETQQMTASAGRAIFELSIDGLTHGTANFIVAVERKPTDDAVMSDSDLSLIQEAIDSAEVIVEVIGDSDPSEVIGEHVDAWLDNHPEATTTVQDGAITAPKINQSLWDKLLVSESASGNPASFNDGADDVPVSSLEVALEPVQLGSGDPSPSNVRPIIAANGKNMMPSGTDGTYTYDGITCVCEGGVYKLTGTSTAETSITIPFVASVDLSPSTNKIAFMNTQASTIVTAFCRDGTRIHYWEMNTLNRVASGWTDSGNEVVDSIRFWIPNGFTLDCTISPMLLLLADSNNPYQPYQGIMVERCGKNLLNDSIRTQAVNNVFFAGATSNVDTEHAFTLKAGTYTYSCVLNDGTTTNLYLRNPVTGTYIRGFPVYNVNSKTFTLDEDTPVVAWTYKNDNLASNIKYAMIERGSVASEYEPFVSNSYPYSLGREVYGGTVDLATGVLTVDRASITLTASNRSGFTAYSPNGRGYWVIPDIKNDSSIIAINALLKASNCPINTTPISSTSSATAMALSGYVNAQGVYIVVPNLATETDFDDYMNENPTQLVYPLAEPQTIQLTPQEVKTLLGYNNISSSGTVDVIYHADTKLYVDKMTNVDNAIIAPTEADYVATRNYTTCDLVIVNDTLYKCTANIASGSAITPNSNVQQTTLGALIKALS